MCLSPRNFSSNILKSSKRRSHSAAYLARMSSNKALKYSLITLTWIPVVMTVNDNVCHVAKIEGSSMRPTLNASDNSVSTDWVFLWKLNCRAAHNLRRNDVILFKSPMDPSKTFCKRIKAIQYDAVQARHPYPRSVVNIPRNHLWVEGDNVYHSVDSNNFGPISAGLVVGKAIKVIWPPSRWGADLKLSTGRPNVLTVRPE